MNDTVKTPWHLWLVAGISLLWNAFGAADYTMSHLGSREWMGSMGFDAATTEAMFAWLAAQPTWTHAAWAFGVWGALAGSLLLFVRSRWAVWGFAASLLGAVASTIHQKTTTYPPELAEIGASPMMYFICTIALLLLLYAVAMQRKGVLR